MRIPVWESLWLLAGAGSVLSKQWDEQTPLTTLTPCSLAPSSVAPPLITVNTQYQPVSTCSASTTSCLKRRCRTQYLYSTYSYVSTVIPCADESTTTVTKTEQTITVSRSTTTITNSYAITSTVTGHWRKPTTTTKTLSTYTTVVKEWSAPYKDIGPLAIPGYSGSGLCKVCNGFNGEKRQIVDAVECSNGDRQPTVCKGAIETWIYNPAPTSSTKVSAICSSRTAVPTAGTYTFAFPRWAPPATFTIPARTITYTADDGPRPTVVTKTITEIITTLPGRPWTAWVTRSCARPTIIEIDITITTTMIYTIPPFTVPCS